MNVKSNATFSFSMEIELSKQEVEAIRDIIGKKSLNDVLSYAERNGIDEQKARIYNVFEGMIYSELDDVI